MPMARQCSDELPSREAGAQDRELDGRVERHVCAHAGRKERQDGKRQAREAAAGRVAVVCGVAYHQSAIPSEPQLHSRCRVGV